MSASTPPSIPETAELSAAILSEDVSPALNQIVLNNIRPVAWGLSVLYLIFGVSHLYLLPDEIKGLMAGVAFGTAVLLLIIGPLPRHFSWSPRYAHPLAALIALLVLVNSFLHLYLVPEPRHTTNVALLIIGIGVFFLSARWFTLILALAIGGWLIISWPTIADPTWVHFAFLQVGGSFIAAMSHTVRLRAARHIERLRLQDKLRRQELRQAAAEARQRASELKQAKENAESANRTKTVFLHKVSHELRTPLTIIIGYAEFLQERNNGSSAPELEAIKGAGRELLAKVNDLIDLSSLEAGQMTIHLSSFKPCELIDDIMSEAQQLMRANRNQLRVFCGEDMGFVTSDIAKMRKILLNLLDNAAKFTEDGEVTLRISRETAVTAPHDIIQLQIADTGIGIAADKMPHLFETFSQGDDSPTRRYGGAGIGLALTKRYCNLLHGDIQIESGDNQGVAVTVRLPVATETLGAPNAASRLEVG